MSPLVELRGRKRKPLTPSQLLSTTIIMETEQKVKQFYSEGTRQEIKKRGQIAPPAATTITRPKSTAKRARFKYESASAIALASPRKPFQVLLLYTEEPKKSIFNVKKVKWFYKERSK